MVWNILKQQGTVTLIEQEDKFCAMENSGEKLRVTIISPWLLLLSSTQNNSETVSNSVCHATFSEMTLLHSYKFTAITW